MIYICIPAYDEERTVGVVLWKIRQVMADFPRDYQVLVLDDGSTDATPDILRPYGRVLPLTVLRHDRRRGYAASLEALLREAAGRSPYPRRDVIVTLQADFTDDPDQIPALVKRIEAGADLVTGSAAPAGADVPRPIRMTRRWLGRLLRWSRWAEAANDPLSGFRAYRVMVVRKALEARGDTPLLLADGWAANAELLRKVLPFARRTDRVEVTQSYGRRRRPSRFRALASALQILGLLRSGKQEPEPDGARDEPEAEAEAEGQAAQEPARERPKRRRGGRRSRSGRSGAGRSRPAANGGVGEAGEAGEGAAAAEGGRGDGAADGAPAKAGAKRRSRSGSRRGRGGSRRPRGGSGGGADGPGAPAPSGGGSPGEA